VPKKRSPYNIQELVGANNGEDDLMAVSFQTEFLSSMLKVTEAQQNDNNNHHNPISWVGYNRCAFSIQ